MPFILLTLFLIALTVVLVGFFLSPRPPVRSSTRGAYVVPRNGRRVVEAATPGVPRRARRYTSGGLTTRQGAPLRASVSISGGELWTRLNGRFVNPLNSWKLISLGLAAIFLLGLYTFTVLFPHQAIFANILFNTNTNQQATPAPQPVYAATGNLIRLSQLDPSQYASQQEWKVWAYSACSAAAMTEVINSYGHTYRITDILKIESGLGEITPALGLLEDIGISRTGTHLGFKTTWGYKLSLDQVIAAANKGTPVIVSFPPAKYDGGHLLVVTGGDQNIVKLADSSLYNRHQLTRAQFLHWWAGFSAIMTPNT